MKESLVIEKLNSIEQQANSQEHPTLLLLSRLRSPEIFEQLVSLYEDYYKQKENYQKPEKIKEKTPEELREIIREELNDRIEIIKNDTPILTNLESGGSRCASFDLFSNNGDYQTCREKIQINEDKYYYRAGYVNPSKWKQTQGITESHEKGHFIRIFSDNYFRKRFCSGLDTNIFSYTPQRALEYSKEVYNIDSLTQESVKKYIDDSKEYLFSGDEIAERMSQLKSYFGMKGNEKFTPEHLVYAREHYISDTGADNNMSEFFSAITKEKEPRFIELINSSGI